MKRYLALWLFLAVALVFAQPTYTLDWGAVTNGGTEFPDGRLAPGYKLADNIGNGSSASDEILTDGVNYVLYPGYRYIDLDLRKPVSAIDSMDTITHSPSFLVSWTGVDTTAEDGEGWGIRYYDVQYAVEDTLAASWNNWHLGVTFTADVFGPTSPVTVKIDSTYYFRVKAYDLATNEEDEHYPCDQKVTYLPASVSFIVYNPASMLPVWACQDTFDVGQTVSMESQDVLIVKNTSTTDSTVLSVKGLPVAIDTLNHFPYWELDDNPSKDKFALRAHFDDETFPPITFGPVDVVRDTFLFTADGYYGGPAHGVLSPYDAAEVVRDTTMWTDNLWLQTLLPTSITQHGDTVVYEFSIQLKGESVTP